MMKQNFLKKFYHKENPKDFLCPKILKRFFGNQDFTMKMNKKAVEFEVMLQIFIWVIVAAILLYAVFVLINKLRG